MDATESVVDETGEANAIVPRQPAERLSLARLALLLIVIAAVVGGAWWVIRDRDETSATYDTSWSVPYVDVTLTPTYQFQNPADNPARDVALAFVVAHPDEPCTPMWGGAYTLDDASSMLDLDRRILQLRAAGGDVMVSFGGQANDELAVACDDVESLTDAYQAVVERYELRAIDLDIEGDALDDTASIERRATAIAAVQEATQADDQELAVWVTLPVNQRGLTPAGTEVVAALLDAGVELAGVNAMTMNFGSEADPTDDMLAATLDALEATRGQVVELYRASGVELDGVAAWEHVGATPMIGQNDVVGEVFTLDDATGLADFALRHGLGRVSMWSLNRDAPCGAQFADVMVLSNTCSSVDQSALDFVRVFSGLPGRSPALPDTESVTIEPDGAVVDDPATSPYPIWRPTAQYPSGYKVVRRGLVYEAKWYNQGDDPAMPQANPWDTAWALVGPVVASDEPFTPTTLADGTHPEWSPTRQYSTGDTVLFEGLPYEARWPNSAEPPETLFPVSPDSAWQPLFRIAGEPENP